MRKITNLNKTNGHVNHQNNFKETPKVNNEERIDRQFSGTLPHLRTISVEALEEPITKTVPYQKATPQHNTTILSD